jgi:hypothetical protein
MTDRRPKAIRGRLLLSAFFSSCRKKKNVKKSLSQMPFSKQCDIQYGSIELSAGLFL